MKDQILRFIASQREGILAFTEALVRVPTENPPGRNYRECVELLEDHLQRMGLSPTVIEVPPPGGGTGETKSDTESYPRYCVLAGYGTGERILYFHGHYDVVPAGSEAQFAPRVENDRLYGRGTADMKSGLAAMIYAVEALQACEVDLDGRIGLVIVPDEETGGWGGAKWLSESGLLGRNGIGMLMPEPTGGVIWNANRGALSLKLTVKGKTAHVGLQHEGINAFERMLVIVGALAHLKSEVEERRTEFRIEPDEARRSILMMGGRLEGGVGFNTVPAKCSFTVDRRINPEEDLETEKQRLFDLFNLIRREGINLEVEILQEGESGGLEEDHPFGREFAAVVEDIRGDPPRFELCPGLLETRFYRALGIPALSYGPGLLSVSHGPEEYVEIERISECAAVYALAAVRLLTNRYS